MVLVGTLHACARSRNSGRQEWRRTDVRGRERRRRQVGVPSSPSDPLSVRRADPTHCGSTPPATSSNACGRFLAFRTRRRGWRSPAVVLLYQPTRTPTGRSPPTLLLFPETPSTEIPLSRRMTMRMAAGGRGRCRTGCVQGTAERRIRLATAPRRGERTRCGRAKSTAGPALFTLALVLPGVATMANDGRRRAIRLDSRSRPAEPAIRCRSRGLNPDAALGGRGF